MGLLFNVGQDFFVVGLKRRRQWFQGYSLHSISEGSIDLELAWLNNSGLRTPRPSRGGHSRVVTTSHSESGHIEEPDPVRSSEAVRPNGTSGGLFLRTRSRLEQRPVSRGLGIRVGNEQDPALGRIQVHQPGLPDNSMMVSGVFPVGRTNVGPWKLWSQFFSCLAPELYVLLSSFFFTDLSCVCVCLLPSSLDCFSASLARLHFGLLLLLLLKSFFFLTGIYMAQAELPDLNVELKYPEFWRVSSWRKK